MKEKRYRRPRRLRRFLLRETLLLLWALLLGMGVSWYRDGAYLPSLTGNVYAMLAAEDSLFLVLSEEGNHNLVRVDRGGTLLNYAHTAARQAFQDLEVMGNTVYAILASSSQGEFRQELVSLSLEDVSMRPERLTSLTDLANVPADGIVWREIYLPPEGEPSPALRLVGIDGEGQGYLLRWSLETGQARFERVLEGEALFSLKYVADGHYVWINREKRAGQFIRGVWQRDVLAGLAGTPCHISTCGERCLISDSVTGDIFELQPDGTASLRRNGGDAVGSSGYPYRKLEIFTTYLDSGGSVRVVGMCADGDGGVIVGETGSITQLYLDIPLYLRMLWQHGWKAALAIWCLLLVLVEVIRSIFASPRLAVRLALCEIVIAAALLSSVTVIQYRSFEDTIREEARQKLHLIGGSLAAALASEDEMSGAEISDRVDALRRQFDEALSDQEKAYSVSVLWSTDNGPVIGCDAGVPEGYLVEDVKIRGYLTAVSGILQRGGNTLIELQNDTGTDSLYVQQFAQGGRTGCVTVSQAEDVLLARCIQFLQRMIPILAACPPLFFALVWLTRRLLRPLDEIQRALEEFYACGGGNQMALEGMPHTELYEVGRVFNQLSLQTKTQFNTLSAINASYERLAPGCLLQFLHKRDVVELSPNEHTPVSGARFVLVSRREVRSAADLEGLARIAAGQTAARGGMLVDYHEGLKALTALFPDAPQALACARGCLDDFEADLWPVMAAVLAETVEFGVFGSEQLLFPLAVSAHTERRQAVLELLCGFGAVLVLSGVQQANLRLLGWDGDVEYFEDPACRPTGWQVQWRDTAGLWARALSQFRERQFAPAMRGFAQALRRMPDDTAARWYLFRCEALRDGGPFPDTGLLYDWEERGHA